MKKMKALKETPIPGLVRPVTRLVPLSPGRIKALSEERGEGWVSNRPKSKRVAKVVYAKVVHGSGKGGTE